MYLLTRCVPGGILSTHFCSIVAAGLWIASLSKMETAGGVPVEAAKVADHQSGMYIFQTQRLNKNYNRKYQSNLNFVKCMYALPKIAIQRKNTNFFVANGVLQFLYLFFIVLNLFISSILAGLSGQDSYRVGHLSKDKEQL